MNYKGEDLEIPEDERHLVLFEFLEEGGMYYCPQCKMGQAETDRTQNGQRQCSNTGCGYVEGEEPVPEKVTCYIM